MTSEIEFIIEVLWQLLAALPTTLGLFAVSMALGIVLSVAVLVMRISRFKTLQWAARIYVTVFRGTPLLIQMYLIYFGLAQLAIINHTILWQLFRSPFICAVFAIACCTAAYTAEILRGGLQAVPPGLVEAGRAIGMNKWQQTVSIVMPMTLRQALPAYSTEAVMIIKSSALASLITVMDVTGAAQQIIQETYRTLDVFICAAGIYLVLNYLIIRAIAYFEGRLSPDIKALNKVSAKNVHRRV